MGRCVQGIVALSTKNPSPAFDPSVLKGVPVLVVEDAWQVARAMKRLLDQLGMNVVGPAATVAEARRLFATFKPVAALVDVNLKGELAWDLINDLCEQGIDVVVISGYPLLDNSQCASVTHLQKPYHPAELVSVLCAIVGKSS
jgi:DNA-binding response OmpR family regulator